MAEALHRRSPTGAVFGGLVTEQTDNVCASGRYDRFLGARHTADEIHHGCGVAE